MANKKTWIRLVFILVISVGFLYFFFKSVEWDRVLSHLTDVRPGLFILVVLLTPLHLLTRAIRWDYLLRHKKKGVSLFNRFAANAVGFTVTLIFPGRLGELVKPYYLAQKEGMKKGFVFGTVVVERIFDIFTMCFLLGFFLLFKPAFSTFFHSDEEIYRRLYYWGIAGMIIASALLLITLCLYFFKMPTFSVITFFLKPVPAKLSTRIMELFEEFVEGLKFFHSIKNLFIYIGLSFFVWLAIVGYYWLFFLSYKESIPFLFIVPFVFLSMVGASIPTPGMVGGFDYFSKWGMTKLYNINDNQAAAMTLVTHALQVVVTCLIGYAILWKEGISLFQVKKLGDKLEL